jgi:asparagine synthase (glutamine-hydrolysing)
MCGICGFIDTSRSDSSEALTASASDMAKALAHRGPDDQGEWADPQAGVALASRRLAIIDITQAGHQPMVSSDGRFVLAFNGEIYNFKDLRRELDRLGRTFRGHSDTEVLVEAFSEWGFAETLERTNGMFGLAAWDRQSRTLFLARDRLGEKPMYYGWLGRTFFFGSELRAMQAHPDFTPTIDRDALNAYMRFNFLPTPFSIYSEIRQLPAGTWVEIAPGKPAEPVPFWSLRDVVQRGQASPLEVSDDDALNTFQELFLDSVERRMISDVPLGAFLSGGIDSSLVVAAMSSLSSVPVRTFTIGFEDSQYDEAKWASQIAGHLATDHTEHYVSAKEALDTIPRLPTLLEEPFADSSQIPTQLVAELARRHVTVALSGDGGDESFAGYPRHHFLKRVMPALNLLPRSARERLGNALRKRRVGDWDRTAEPFTRFLPGAMKGARVGERLHRVADFLTLSESADVYRELLSVNHDPSGLVLGSTEPPLIVGPTHSWPRTIDAMHNMMYLDTSVYLPDDILTKVDRATMATSLEARVPFLDHRLIEFAWRLPSNLKFRNGAGKYLPRKLLSRYVPDHLFERPKMGFGVPLATWLRGPLRPWAEELLSPEKLRNDGYLNAELVRTMWDEHISAARDHHHRLWGVLVFQAWLQRQHGV